MERRDPNGEFISYAFASSTRLLAPSRLVVPLTTSLRIQGEVYKRLSLYAELQFWLSLGERLWVENWRYYEEGPSQAEAITKFFAASQQTGRKPQASYYSPFTDTRTSMMFGLIYRLASWGNKDRGVPVPQYD